MKKHIPNFLTSLNLFFGCMAIMLAFRGNPEYAAWCILISALLDFADGFAARLLHAYSDIGKELDSLADVISFGVAPAAILYQLTATSLAVNHPEFSIAHPAFTEWILLLAPFIIPVFSALRLAKFNLDERQTSSFIGLPTPANALFFLSLTFWNAHSLYEQLMGISWILPVLILIFSYLLVSEIPMFSLKIKNLSWKGNEIRMCFLIISLILFGLFGFKSLTLIIILYILLSALTPFIFRPDVAK